MNNLILGKYIPLDSFVHKLDPRAKILALFMIITAIFIDAKWLGCMDLIRCVIFSFKII